MRISDWSSDVCSSDLTAIQSAVLLARRQEIINALVRGDRFCDIDRRLGLNKDARRNLRFLTPEQSAARERNLRNRYVIAGNRSEEHTSELQSLMRISYAVFCLKKKIENKTQITHSRIKAYEHIT